MPTLQCLDGRKREQCLLCSVWMAEKREQCLLCCVLKAEKREQCLLCCVLIAEVTVSGGDWAEEEEGQGVNN